MLEKYEENAVLPSLHSSDGHDSWASLYRLSIFANDHSQY